jgi:hypothetical protein
METNRFSLKLEYTVEIIIHNIGLGWKLNFVNLRTAYVRQAIVTGIRQKPPLPTARSPRR